jgi:hypothetical protein
LGKTFVRRCGAEDNLAEVLSTIYGGGPDPNKRKAVPDADVWQFDQQSSIDALKNERMPISGVLGTLFTEERMKD